MNNLSMFLNTKVVDSGVLAAIGDFGLAPVRYLFGGKTICIKQRGEFVDLGETAREMDVYHIASFHKKGPSNRSDLDSQLRSSSTGLYKTIISVVLLVPGLLLSAFKGMSYFFSEARNNQTLAKLHLTPVDRHVGTFAAPIKSEAELCEALEKMKDDPKHRPTNALIVHAAGKVVIGSAPAIMDHFNPMKLILEGAVLDIRDGGNLAQKMVNSKKWSEPNGTSPGSIERALDSVASKRSWNSSKRFHEVFTIARPK